MQHLLDEQAGVVARRQLETLAARQHVPRRAWIAAVLGDVAEGTCSVLEHGYVARVERPHGIPRARRQVRAVIAGAPVYRDAEIDERIVVELDGRMFHDSTTARDRDMERDLDASVVGRTTVRLGWGQVFDRPCSTAQKIGQLLAVHGWTGGLRRCGTSCSVSGNFPVTW